MQIRVVVCDCCKTEESADRAGGWPKFNASLMNGGETHAIAEELDVCPECAFKLTSTIRSMLDPRNILTDEGDMLSLAEVEKAHAMLTLNRVNWNKSEASRILGIERSTLDRKLRAWEVVRPGTKRQLELPPRDLTGDRNQFVTVAVDIPALAGAVS